MNRITEENSNEFLKRFDFFNGSDLLKFLFRFDDFTKKEHCVVEFNCFDQVEKSYLTCSLDMSDVTDFKFAREIDTSYLAMSGFPNSVLFYFDADDILICVEPNFMEVSRENIMNSNFYIRGKELRYNLLEI